MTQALPWLTAAALIEGYRAGSFSPVEVLQEALRRLDAYEPVLNAFAYLAREEALAEASASAGRWRAGSPKGALDGVPVTVKDTVDVADWPTRKGSLLTSPDHRAAEDAPSVARLREAGAILFGKTTVPEFAWKAMTDSPLQGVTRNPWNPSRTTGGSTGGGSAAVAAGIGPLGHGTDGGGSLRMPPSFCGVVGFKPTHGRVPYLPQEGVGASLVVEGPVARSVLDVALVMNELKKPDPRDPLCLPPDAADWTCGLEAPLDGLRIAYSPGFAGAEPAPALLALMADAVAAFRAQGAVVEEVGPIVGPLQPRFEAHWMATMGQALRGIPPEKRGLLDPMLRRLGEEGLGRPAEDAWQGLHERQLLGQEMAAFHLRYPLLLTPTMLDPAPPADTLYHASAFTRWRATAYTLAANLTGQPAISLPAGLLEGLPVGLQIMGPRFSEALVLRAARAFERERGPWAPHPVLLASLDRLSAV